MDLLRIFLESFDMIYERKYIMGKFVFKEQWKKNKSYYYKKSWERAYHEYETYFVEGSPRQALELAVQLQNSLTRNLEKMIYEGLGVEYVGTAEFGRAEYAFTTKEYIDQWKIKMDFYPCILA